MKTNRDRAPVDQDSIVSKVFERQHQDGSRATAKSWPVTQAKLPSADRRSVLDPTASPTVQKDQRPEQWQQDVSKPRLESIDSQRTDRLR